MSKSAVDLRYVICIDPVASDIRKPDVALNGAELCQPLEGAFAALLRVGGA